MVTETNEVKVLYEGDKEVKQKGKVIILATEGPEAYKLLNKNESIEKESRGSICMYFKTKGNPPKSISKFPILILNGNPIQHGPVNNMFIPNAIASNYAPKGYTLISTTIVIDNNDNRSNQELIWLTDNEIEMKVRGKMTEWFGIDQVKQWEFLKCYRIPHSQTPQSPPFNFDKSTRVNEQVFVCGDHRKTPTLDGAFESGIGAATEALKVLNVGEV